MTKGNVCPWVKVTLVGAWKPGIPTSQGQPWGSGPSARSASLLSKQRSSANAVCSQWVSQECAQVGRLCSQLYSRLVTEKAPHPAFSNKHGPNFRRFPDPFPIVPDAPKPPMHFSPVLAFPCLALSSSRLSNICNHWALQRTALNLSQCAGVCLSIGMVVNTCAPDHGYRSASICVNRCL